jgi:hypothetical protein
MVLKGMKYSFDDGKICKIKLGSSFVTVVIS